LWEDGEIKKRKPAHEDSILALDCKEDSDLFVTGSLNGYVFLWRLVSETQKKKDQSKQLIFGIKNDYVKDVERLASFNVAKGVDPLMAVLMPRYNVQSVHLSVGKIIIGTRSGAIY